MHAQTLLWGVLIREGRGGWRENAEQPLLRHCMITRGPLQAPAITREPPPGTRVSGRRGYGVAAKSGDDERPAQGGGRYGWCGWWGANPPKKALPMNTPKVIDHVSRHPEVSGGGSTLIISHPS